jgi:hypothetical protein
MRKESVGANALPAMAPATAARRFCLSRMAGLHAPGLSRGELTRLCATCGVKSPLLQEWLREEGAALS